MLLHVMVLDSDDSRIMTSQINNLIEPEQHDYYMNYRLQNMVTSEDLGKNIWVEIRVYERSEMIKFSRKTV